MRRRAFILLRGGAAAGAAMLALFPGPTLSAKNAWRAETQLRRETRLSRSGDRTRACRQRPILTLSVETGLPELHLAGSGGLLSNSPRDASQKRIKDRRHDAEYGR